jgi:hypothetical protein
VKEPQCVLIPGVILDSRDEILEATGSIGSADIFAGLKVSEFVCCLFLNPHRLMVYSVFAIKT